MNKAQTDQTSEAPAAPAEERAARQLRVLARLSEIQMEVAEATRTEAVEAPQPGVDYCARVAGIARSVRLTLLLEDKMSRPSEERPRKAGQAWADSRARSRLRVTLAMGAAVTDEAGIEQDEANRRFVEMAERLERPELAELVETCPPLVAVTRLCRMFGLPEEAERWLEIGDVALAERAIRMSGEAAAAPGPAGAEALDQGKIRRRLRVIMALSAAIKVEAEGKDEYEHRFCEMAGQMDGPEEMEIAENCPAVDAVARLCPRFGLPPEQAERWVAESDRFLATLDLPPVDPPEPPDTG
ncbi:hypothetical protein AB4Z01_03210 [Inquilinus sp. YAF38]|uniref:hypothetical protein n=1 Tax=Inquilinus sp. YAF38 TaxID=3233084 RepID=UPI003F8F9C03